MTDERVAPWIVRQIETHLGMIFAGIFAAFSAYLIGTTTVGLKLEEIEKQDEQTAKAIEKIEGRLSEAELRVERLSTQAEYARDERMKDSR